MKKVAETQPWVKEIALVGHSQGGVVVSMVCGELGDSVVNAEGFLPLRQCFAMMP